MWKPAKPPFRSYKKSVFQQAAKVSSFIYQIGKYPELRKPSKEVSVKRITSQDIKNKLAYLKKCLAQYTKDTGHGRGVAAVQVGIPERFFVYYSTLDKKTMSVIINPKITKQSERLFRYPEICMSANPVIVPIIRPSWIEFEYYDEKGRFQQWKTKDDTQFGKMMNRILQHEIDHMDGTINIDLVKSPKELILESEPNFYKKATFVEV